MLQEIGQFNGAMSGIGALIGNQRPFVNFLVENWPLTLIAGGVLWYRLKERHQKKTLSTFAVATDAGLVLTPLIGIALVNHLANKSKATVERLVMSADDHRENSNSPVPGT